MLTFGLLRLELRESRQSHYVYQPGIPSSLQDLAELNLLHMPHCFFQLLGQVVTLPMLLCQDYRQR